MKNDKLRDGLSVPDPLKRLFGIRRIIALLLLTAVNNSSAFAVLFPFEISVVRILSLYTRIERLQERFKAANTIHQRGYPDLPLVVFNYDEQDRLSYRNDLL